MFTSVRSTRDQLIVATIVVALLYVGRVVFIPLVYSLILAIVLFPMVSRMERARIPRAVAITLALLLVTALFGALLGVLFWQVNVFLEKLPALRMRSAGTLSDLMVWLQHVIPQEPGDDADQWGALLKAVPSGVSGILISTLNALFGMVVNLFIIPLITALLLYDRQRYVRALVEAAGPSLRPLLTDVLHKSVTSYARFIGGMVKVYVIVGVLNSIGLALLGVENAILFGMVSAIMTIVPYIGIIVSALLPMSVAWIATGDVMYPVGVVAVFAVVQYLEANVIFPKVVGHQLNLNMLASLVIVLAGALLWGVSGMILLLPCMAIVKIISAQVPSMRAIHLLLGDEEPDGKSDRGR